jgi:hypothetical protein
MAVSNHPTQQAAAHPSKYRALCGTRDKQFYMNRIRITEKEAT